MSNSEFDKKKISFCTKLFIFKLSSKRAIFPTQQWSFILSHIKLKRIKAQIFVSSNQKNQQKNNLEDTDVNSDD
ncbi:hypothetical protein BpHYR1_009534 [Brachionus plicatilis]|uniref:Uncharacterized protein n=1 Tax=Brachionus plicatilis TaxID=10195 RepID=A0A3M7STZ6_BRAPC|nr:hypothetical protein BpHYR1_009534 [Brachionus plicatilis]